MKVHKSSEECAKFNALNAEYIATGLVEANEPNDQVLANEAKAAAEKAAGVKRFTAKVGILHAIWLALPENLRALYQEPKAVEGKDDYCPTMVSVGNLYLDGITLESFSGGDRWSSRHSCYRLEIGGYGDGAGRYIKLNAELTISQAQITKAVNKLADKYAQRVAKQNLAKKTADAEALRNDWLKDPDNNKIAQVILGTTFIGWSDASKVSITDDARVTINYETLTVAQWREVAALKLAQQAAMKALKDSFKPATATISPKA